MYKNVRVTQSQLKRKKTSRRYIYGARERIIISNMLSVTIRAESITAKY